MSSKFPPSNNATDEKPIFVAFVSFAVISASRIRASRSLGWKLLDLHSPIFDLRSLNVWVEG